MVIPSSVLRTLPCAHLDDDLFTRCLRHALPRADHQAVRAHLDGCPACWARWNRFRWDRAKGTRGYAEMQAYLGAEFQEYLDYSWLLARDWTRRNPQTAAEVTAFYKEVPYYVYDLLIWKESGNRPRYVDAARPLLEKHGSRVICDFGCGIGNDGLQLLDLGYAVLFCDFDNPSTRFLRWRLARRHLIAPLVSPENLAALGPFDTLWAMDVIEHLPDVAGTLGPLLARARTVIYQWDHNDRAGGRQPFHIQHDPADLARLFTHYGFCHDPSAELVQVWYKPRGGDPATADRTDGLHRSSPDPLTPSGIP